MSTAIEWTDETWNPVVGCDQVSPGCAHCYAKELHDKRHKAYLAGKKVAPQYAHPFEVVQLKPERLGMPLGWRKPRRVFVNSVSDLFHDDVPDGFLDLVFGTMVKTPQHTYQILTKRPRRMRDYCNARLLGLPLRNVWLGVSVENQRFADERIPFLLDTPAAVRFLSCEPLLGRVDLLNVCESDERYIDALNGARFTSHQGAVVRPTRFAHVDWVIVGGESGNDARPMHPDWARSIREQCVDAGVPFFFKQWGQHRPAELVDDDRREPWRRDPDGSEAWALDEHGVDRATLPAVAFYEVGKKKAGRLLDGREWNEFPAGAA